MNTPSIQFKDIGLFDRIFEYNNRTPFHRNDQVIITPPSISLSSSSPPPPSPPIHSFDFNPPHRVTSFHTYQYPTLTSNEIPYQHPLPNINSRSFNHSSNSSFICRQPHPSDGGHSAATTYELFIKKQQQQNPTTHCCCCHAHNDKTSSASHSINNNNNNDTLIIIRDDTSECEFDDNESSSLPDENINPAPTIDDSATSSSRLRKTTIKKSPPIGRPKIINKKPSSTRISRKSKQKILQKKKKNIIHKCISSGCGKTFGSASDLFDHAKRHITNRDQLHACPWPGCKWKFARFDRVIRHYR
jgi:hypothetical protein